MSTNAPSSYQLFKRFLGLSKEFLENFYLAKPQALFMAEFNSCLESNGREKWRRLKGLLSSRSFKALKESTKKDCLTQALCTACHENEVATVDSILHNQKLTAHLDLTRLNAQQKTPLDFCIDLNLMKYLIAYARQNKMEEFSWWIEKGFIEACGSGQIEKVKFFLTDESLSDVPLTPFGGGLKAAFAGEQSQVVNYLLSLMPTTQPFAPYDDQMGAEAWQTPSKETTAPRVMEAIVQAIEQGSWTALENVLFSTNFLELKLNWQTQDVMNDILWEACCRGQLEIVSNILTNKKLEQHALPFADANHQANDSFLGTTRFLISKVQKIHKNSNKNYHYLRQSPLTLACQHGHLDVVKFLLENKDIDHRVDIHILDDFPLKVAHSYGRHDIVDYLLFEQNLEFTKDLQWWSKNRPTLQDKFTAREFKNRVDNALPLKQSPKRRPKL